MLTYIMPLESILATASEQSILYKRRRFPLHDTMDVDWNQNRGREIAQTAATISDTTLRLVRRE